MKTAYRKQRSDARFRGIGWEFTFESWLEVWVASGHLSERGCGKGKYVMARFGDDGPYAAGNVEIILFEKNMSDAQKNKPSTTEERRARVLGTGRGWTYVKGGYQVCVAHRYIGRFKTEADALSARSAALAAISGIGRESPGKVAP